MKVTVNVTIPTAGYIYEGLSVVISIVPIKFFLCSIFPPFFHLLLIVDKCTNEYLYGNTFYY